MRGRYFLLDEEPSGARAPNFLESDPSTDSEEGIRLHARWKEAEDESVRREELKELENNLAGHREMWTLLDSALRKSWPEVDKVGDRLH